MELTPRRRRALATALALVLALESVTVVGAAALTSSVPRGPHALPGVPPAGLVLAQSSADEPGAAAAATSEAPAPAVDGSVAGVPAQPIAESLIVPVALPVAEPAAAAGAPAAPARAPVPERAAKASKTTPARSGSGSGSASGSSRSGSSGATARTGRNHVWIPALGINRSVSFYPCDRNRPLANHVYRWGCAEANNVYLMGHAHSVFDPLHDAYVAGRLRVGMKAWYADSKGRVRAYAVKWWKVTLPTNAGWAWAAQSRPSMTLQTCVGSNGKYRLVVRLVEVDG